MSESKKTKVKVFVKLFNDIKDRDQEKELDRKAKFVAKYIDKTYVPYAIKMSEAIRIVERSSYTDLDGTKIFSLSSPMRWVLFVICIINYYTSLEIDDNDAMTDYDLLDQVGAIDIIFSLIGKDIESFNTVLTMTYDDMMENERSTTAFLDRQIAAIKLLLDNIDTSAIEDAAKSLNKNDE